MAFSLIMGSALSYFKTIKDIENWTLDIRVLSFSPKTEVNSDIVMVWLDESAISQLPYRTPIPRDFIARLNDRIWEGRPLIVAYDIFFKDSSFHDADKVLAQSFKNRDVYSVAPMRGSEIEVSLPFFQEVLKGVGVADFPFSAFDQSVRKTKFVFGDDKKFLSLPALLFENVSRKKIEDVVPKSSYDDEGRVMIRFVGPPSEIGREGNAFKVFSAGLVEKGLIPKSWFDGKIVLVGASYQDLKDSFITPFYSSSTKYSKMNGVEIHANVLNDLLTNQFYKYFSQGVFFVIMLVLTSMIGASSLFWSPLRTAVVGLSALIFEFFFSILMFNKAASIVPMVYPTLVFLSCAGAGIGIRALTEGREKRFIRSVFTKYVPPTVVGRIIDDPSLLKLGGEERVVTSLFSDIASFTTISEKFSPTVLVSFLNEYLGEMNNVLFKYGATLDKYEGDAIIAFFNAPLDLDDHEMKAVLCAIEMQEAGRKVSKAWAKMVGREVVTRIGINTGQSVVGNMGSEGRFDYTAIGDTINLASRLEGANKFYGTLMLMSERVAIKLNSSVIKRPIDRVRVKGKSQPILLFEVIATEDRFRRDLKDTFLNPYLNAFESFEKREFERAFEIIEGVVKRFPDDRSSQLLMERCKRGVADPKMDLVTSLGEK